METLLLLSIALIGTGLLTINLTQRTYNGWIIGWFIIAAGISGAVVAGWSWAAQAALIS